MSLLSISNSAEHARAMRAALDVVDGQLGREYDLIIGGHRIEDRGQDPVAESGAAGAGGGRAPEGRRRACRVRP